MGIERVILATVVAGLLVVALVGTFVWASRTRRDSTARKILLGLAAGLLGVAVVGIPTSDLVPDSWEPTAILILAVGLVLVLALATLRRHLSS